MANREGIRIDQKIQVQTVQGIKTFTVRGLLEPDGPAKALGGDIAIMDIYAAQTGLRQGQADRPHRHQHHPRRDARLRQRHASSPHCRRDTISTPRRAGPGRSKTSWARFRKSMDLISFMALFVGHVPYLQYRVHLRGTAEKRDRHSARTRSTQGQIMRTVSRGDRGTRSARLGPGCRARHRLCQTLDQRGGPDRIVHVRTLPGHGAGASRCIGMLRNIGIGIIASVLAAIFPARSSTHVAPVSAIRSQPYAMNGTAAGTRLLTLFSTSLIALAGFIIVVYKTVGLASPIRNSMTTTIAMICLLLGISLAAPLFLKWFIIAVPVGHRAASRRRRPARRSEPREEPVAERGRCGRRVFQHLAFRKLGEHDQQRAQGRPGLYRCRGEERHHHNLRSPPGTAGAQTIPMPLSMARELEAIPGVASADPFRKLFLNISGKRVLLEMIDVAALAAAQYLHGHRRQVR